MTHHDRQRLYRLALVALLAMPLAALRAQDATDRPPDAPLHAGDALLIRIDNIGGRLPAYREIIDRDGDIELPFLGMMAADGKSIPALQEEMAAAYNQARLASNATVTITYITHFDPPPDRATLVRAAPPRIPVPAALPPTNVHPLHP
ncbi:MAG: polysaccharide biosynthesis/export family protein [Kiritimatiellae bacterium]|nr:polysaccharide biosynthesis/export family protein [Kiritimatiellia bacterium]